METKKEIKPIYTELKGLLSQIPSVESNDPDKPSFSLSQLSYFEAIVEKIEKILPDNDFSRFKVDRINYYGHKDGFSISEFRQKVSGLIMLLYGNYFEHENEPFSGQPSTIISQNQQQSQSAYIQILLDFQSMIEEKMPNFEKNSKEATFLEKLKNSLSSVKDINQLILTIMTLGSSLGLTIDQILNIFK